MLAQLNPLRLQHLLLVKDTDLLQVLYTLKLLLWCAGSVMGAGDAGMEDIWHWDEQGPRIAFKGPNGNTGDIPYVHARKTWSSLAAGCICMLHMQA